MHLTDTATVNKMYLTGTQSIKFIPNMSQSHRLIMTRIIEINLVNATVAIL